MQKKWEKDFENLIKNLPDEPMRAIVAICEEILRWDTNIANGDPEQRNSSNTRLDNYDFYLESMGLLVAFIEASGIDFTPPKLGPDKFINMRQILTFIERCKIEAISEVIQLESMDYLNEAKTKYSVKFNKGFYYEFSEDDLGTIQSIIDDLKQIVENNNQLNNDHKRRLTNRFEKLQSELNKKVANLDRFWGLVGEAGVIMRKNGRSAKPIVDRIGKITDLVWRSQSVAEELKTGQPFPLFKVNKRN